MIRSIVRLWRSRSQRANLATLANRLGPHIARDIGIESAATIAVLPVLRPFLV